MDDEPKGHQNLRRKRLIYPRDFADIDFSKLPWDLQPLSPVLLHPEPCQEADEPIVVSAT